MGKNREERLRLAGSQAAALAEANDLQADVLSSERAMAWAESLLGSDAQLGASSVDPRLSGYAERYVVDPQAASILLEQQKLLRRKTGLGSEGDLRAVANRANALLDQAEAAARSGDFVQAERLREQAQRALPSFGQDVWQLRGTDSSERLRAEGLAFSPVGQVVGEEVRRARDLQERGEGYERFFDVLTDDALDALEAGRTLADRQLAISERSARSRMGEISAQRGAARTPHIQEALEGRLSASYATERANLDLEFATEASKVVGEARRFLEKYTDELAKSSVELARWFVTGAPGFRDEHQNRLVTLSRTAIEVNDRIAARAHDFLQSKKNGPGPAAQLAIQAGAAIASIIAGAVTGGVGGARDAGAGSAALGASNAAGGFESVTNPYDRAFNQGGGLTLSGGF